MTESRDVVHAVLWSTNNRNRIAWLPNAADIDVTRKLNTPDECSFMVPLNDATTIHLIERRIVRFTWYHDGVAVQRSACRLQGEAAELVVDGKRWLQFQNQPGLLGMLEDGTVYPEGGLTPHAADDRLFGPMSASGAWRVDANWITPQGFPFDEMTGVRKGYPPQLKSSGAYWISAVNPHTFVLGSAANYFRGHYTATETKRALFVCTGDNYTTAHHNGVEIITPDPSNSLMWRDAYSIPLTLHPGDHLFHAEVRNAPRAAAGGRSPVAFIADLYEVDDAGKIIGSLLKTNLTEWAVHDNTPEPGWYPAQVLKTVFLEAQDIGFAGPGYLHLGFTDFHDSAGQAWSGPRGTFSVAVGNVSLLDVVAQLVEFGLDVSVDTVRMKLQAWNRLGRDRYSTVEIKPANEGGNALSISTSRTHSRFNSVLTRLDDGTLIEVHDQASVDQWNRIGAGLSLAASTVATATRVARAQMAESAQSQTHIQVELTSTFGLIPGRQFDLGDSVKCRDTRNAPIKGRVMSLTWKLAKPGEAPQVFAEIEQDFT